MPREAAGGLRLWPARHRRRGGARRAARSAGAPTGRAAERDREAGDRDARGRGGRARSVRQRGRCTRSPLEHDPDDKTPTDDRAARPRHARVALAARRRLRRGHAGRARGRARRRGVRGARHARRHGDRARPASTAGRRGSGVARRHGRCASRRRAMPCVVSRRRSRGRARCRDGAAARASSRATTARPCARPCIELAGTTLVVTAERGRVVGRLPRARHDRRRGRSRSMAWCVRSSAVARRRARRARGWRCRTASTRAPARDHRDARPRPGVDARPASSSPGRRSVGPIPGDRAAAGARAAPGGRPARTATTDVIRMPPPMSDAGSATRRRSATAGSSRSTSSPGGCARATTTRSSGPVVPATARGPARQPAGRRVRLRATRGTRARSAHAAIRCAASRCPTRPRPVACSRRSSTGPRSPARCSRSAATCRAVLIAPA